jgi:hypothetical protein
MQPDMRCAQKPVEVLLYTRFEWRMHFTSTGMGEPYAQIVISLSRKCKSGGDVGSTTVSARRPRRSIGRREGFGAKAGMQRGESISVLLTITITIRISIRRIFFRFRDRLCLRFVDE